MSPSVTTIVATRGRPELLRVAVRSILAQDYDGPIEVLVVYDHIEIDPIDDVEVPDPHTVRTISNEHPQGLAGGRNTGIDAASGELMCFCDDDDSWEPAKLRRQVEILGEHPDASIVAAGIRIESEGGTNVRLPPAKVGLDDLLRSRITEIHPSGFLMRTEWFRRELGGIDEDIPSSFGEDYDLMLRAVKKGPIVSVTEPLVVVNWNRPSFFTTKWQGIAEGLEYILEQHPEFEDCPEGYARIAGQIAFARAALKERKAASTWARAALKRDKKQLRAYASFAVAWRLVSPAWLVAAANRRGHGL